MNWVGGVRKRVRSKEEKRIQKEYFEKKRFMTKLNRVCDASPSKRRAAISQDLLSIHTVNHLHKTTQGKSLQGNFKRVNHVDLEKVFDPFINFRKRERNLELPMSPIETPSKLELQDYHVPRVAKSGHSCGGIASENTSTESSSQKYQLKASEPVYEDEQNTENLQNIRKYTPYLQPVEQNQSCMIRSLFDGNKQMENRETTCYVGQARSTNVRKEDQVYSSSQWSRSSHVSSPASSRPYSPDILFQPEVFKSSTQFPQEQQVSTFLQEQIIPRGDMCNTTSRSSYSKAVPAFSSSLRRAFSSIDGTHHTSTPLAALSFQDNSTVIPHLEPNQFGEYIINADCENDNQHMLNPSGVRHEPRSTFLKQQEDSKDFQTREGSVDLLSQDITCAFAPESNLNYESHLSMILNQTNKFSQVPSVESSHKLHQSLQPQYTRPTSPGSYKGEPTQGLESNTSQRCVNSPKWEDRCKAGSLNNRFGSMADSGRNTGWRSFIFDSDDQKKSYQSHDNVEEETTRLKMNKISEEVLREVLSLDEELMDEITTQQIDDTALDRDFSALSSTQSSYVNDYYQECFTIENSPSQESANLCADTDVNQDEKTINKAPEELNTPILKMDQTGASTDDDLINDQRYEPRASVVEMSCDISTQFNNAEYTKGTPACRIDCSTQTTGVHCTTCKCLNSSEPSVVRSKPQQMLVETLRPDLAQDTDANVSHGDYIQLQPKQTICEIHPSANMLMSNEDCSASSYYQDSQLDPFDENGDNKENICLVTQSKENRDNKENICLVTHSKENMKNSVRYSLRTRNVNK